LATTSLVQKPTQPFRGGRSRAFKRERAFDWTGSPSCTPAALSSPPDRGGDWFAGASIHGGGANLDGAWLYVWAAAGGDPRCSTGPASAPRRVQLRATLSFRRGPLPHGHATGDCSHVGTTDALPGGRTRDRLGAELQCTLRGTGLTKCAQLHHHSDARFGRRMGSPSRYMGELP
jgi:hypothetical protein